MRWHNRSPAQGGCIAGSLGTRESADMAVMGERRRH
jgi:hypothetical protein